MSAEAGARRSVYQQELGSRLACAALGSDKYTSESPAGHGVFNVHEWDRIEHLHVLPMLEAQFALEGRSAAMLHFQNYLRDTEWPGWSTTGSWLRWCHGACMA